MNISSLQGHTKASEVPIEKLSSSAQFSQEEKIAEVARQFEAVLLRQIMGQAQKTVIASKVNPQSVSSGIYKDMITAQMADSATASGGVGLAKSFQQQLSRQIRGKDLDAPAPATSGKIQV